MSGSVIENSRNDIDSMRRCVSTLVCEIGNVNRVEIEKSQEKGRIVMKNFKCVRKYESWVWKW